MHLSKKHGYSIKEIQKDGFKISSKVDMIPKGNSGYFMSKALGEGIIKFSILPLMYVIFLLLLFSK